MFEFDANIELDDDPPPSPLHDNIISSLINSLDGTPTFNVPKVETSFLFDDFVQKGNSNKSTIVADRFLSSNLDVRISDGTSCSNENVESTSTVIDPNYSESVDDFAGPFISSVESVANSHLDFIKDSKNIGLSSFESTNHQLQSTSAASRTFRSSLSTPVNIPCSSPGADVYVNSLSGSVANDVCSSNVDDDNDGLLGAEIVWKDCRRKKDYSNLGKRQLSARNGKKLMLMFVYACMNKLVSYLCMSYEKSDV